MIDREKVIKGLECCLGDTRTDLTNLCTICQYAHGSYATQTCGKKLREDAIALLKAQEQEIEDLKQEIEGHKENLRETLDEMMRYADELKAQEPRLVEPNDFENADDFNWLPAWCEERPGAGYWEMILPDALDEKDVRYWTGRPTQEQMEATPWN